MIVGRRGVRYTRDDVEHRLDYGRLSGDRSQHAIFWLARGDTVADLRFTDRHIAGPARVEFTRYFDGIGGLATSVTNHATTVIGAA